MKALILNSGMGKRMGELTSRYPKCMSALTPEDTIVSRQLDLLVAHGVQQIVMTTGLFHQVLIDYCKERASHITFVHNPLYDQTNYIYSIYCARNKLRGDDLLLLHGDLVFDGEVLEKVLNSPDSCMVVSSTQPVPQKDFKAVIHDGHIDKVGIEFFDSALAAQPLYFLKQADWEKWLDAICDFCERGEKSCYAENALNTVSDAMNLTPLDVRDMLCAEVDTPQELETVGQRVEALKQRVVYMCFSSDILHSGHFAIIRKAASLGRLIIGALSDQAIAGYKRLPMINYEQRAEMLKSIKGVSQVILQPSLSYRSVLENLQPDIVVHGDDWRSGFQRAIRNEVVDILASYGGRLIEYAYDTAAEEKARQQGVYTAASMPDIRRGSLRRALELKPLIKAIETHSGITGLIAEKTVVYEKGQARSFDAMWVSSLCDSTAKGKPDIELVDMSSRFRTIDDIMEVTTKPIIFDGDTGGLTEHFVYTVRTLERMGVSMIIIEDKTGLKKNSLFGTEVAQTQDSIENFCNKIRAGKRAQKTKDFMICARIESLILEQGMEDALKRAFAFVEAGADAIMIHSRKKDPAEIFAFVEAFRAQNTVTPIVVVPTSFNEVTEEEFEKRGVNIVIYANQLTRTGFPAMQHAAQLILQSHRAKECDDICMPFKEIIRLIPDEI